MADAYLWIMAGQSNNLGMGVGVQTPDCDPLLALEWESGQGLVPLDEPRSWTSAYKPQTGSAWPAFANMVVEASEAVNVIVRTAIGGTALLAANALSNGDWSPTGALFGNAVTRAQAAKAAIETAGHTVVGINVVWHQGERDAQGNNDLANYQAATQALVGRFRTALSWPALKVYAIRIGTMTAGDSGPGWQVVRDAQVAAAEAEAGMEMAYLRCVDFPGLGWMKLDGIHYSQSGLTDMGTAVGQFVADDLGLTVPPTPPPPVGVTSAIARRLLMSS